MAEPLVQPLRIGIVGLGKIALEEHVPAVYANPAFELVAVAGAQAALDGIASFAGVEAMLAGCPGLDVVAVCTPPQAHFDAAGLALKHGKHVLLEKPPCPTLAEFEDLIALAQRRGRILFQSWHARETAAVDRAAEWLAPRAVRRGKVVWKEDVRLWHPGQAWIWQDGGFGVLDAGINAISILTKIMPEPLAVESAHLWVPENCASPIAAAVALRTASGAVIDAEFDFRHRGDTLRVITLETEGGPLTLAWKGAQTDGDGLLVELGSQRDEYTALYQHFVRVLARGRSEVDKRPLELVCEILSVAGRTTVAPFVE